MLKVFFRRYRKLPYFVRSGIGLRIMYCGYCRGSSVSKTLINIDEDSGVFSPTSILGKSSIHNTITQKFLKKRVWEF